MNARKIVLVTPYPPIKSGVSEYAKYISDFLSRKNINLYIITFTNGNDVKLVESEDGKIIIRVLNDNPTSITNFFKLLKKIDPDVIHYNLHMNAWSNRKSLNFLYSSIPLLTKLILRKKVVVTMHNIIEFIDKDPLRKTYSITSLTRLFGYVATWIYSRVDNVVMLTKLYSTYMRKKYRANVRYVPHGFLIGKNGYVKKDNLFKIGVVGFISPYKRYDVILSAYKRVKEWIPSTRLKIIGGPHPNFPEIYYSLRNDVYDGIKITGYVSRDELISHIETLDVVIFPYIGWAGVSGALHLAVSLNKPIIVSDIPEMRWLARELNIKAMFFDLNDVEDLAKKIIALYKDDDLRREMIRHNSRVAEKLSMDRVAELYLKIYNQS